MSRLYYDPVDCKNRQLCYHYIRRCFKKKKNSIERGGRKICTSSIYFNITLLTVKSFLIRRGIKNRVSFSFYFLCKYNITVYINIMYYIIFCVIERYDFTNILGRSSLSRIAAPHRK